MPGDGCASTRSRRSVGDEISDNDFEHRPRYFKASDYDQTVGTDATIGATVKFYSLQTHTPRARGG